MIGAYFHYLALSERSQISLGQVANSGGARLQWRPGVADVNFRESVPSFDGNKTVAGVSLPRGPHKRQQEPAPSRAPSRVRIDGDQTASSAARLRLQRYALSRSFRLVLESKSIIPERSYATLSEMILVFISSPDFLPLWRPDRFELSPWGWTTYAAGFKMLPPHSLML